MEEIGRQIEIGKLLRVNNETLLQMCGTLEKQVEVELGQRRYAQEESDKGQKQNVDDNPRCVQIGCTSTYTNNCPHESGCKYCNDQFKLKTKQKASKKNQECPWSTQEPLPCMDMLYVK